MSKIKKGDGVVMQAKSRLPYEGDNWSPNSLCISEVKPNKRGDSGVLA
jgi:hypothetical protein